MTDTTIITLVAAIPTTIASIGALLIGLRTSAKADVIHTLTNSSLSTATNALAVANETIKGLQATLASMVDAKKVEDLKGARDKSKP